MNTTWVDWLSTPAKALLIAKLKLVTFPDAGLPKHNPIITHHVFNHQDIASTGDPEVYSNVIPFRPWGVVREVDEHILDLHF